jgi:DNA-directed RNA polymerase sigma subunit (sigma70/sigma32)
MDRNRLPSDAAVLETGPIPCGCLRPRPLIERIDPAYLDSLLARILPFEAWVVRQRHGLSDPFHPPRSAEEVGIECGLPEWRIVEIEGRALMKMLALQTSLATH